MCAAVPMPIFNYNTTHSLCSMRIFQVVSYVMNLHCINCLLVYVFLRLCDRFSDSILFIVIFMCEPRLLHHSTSTSSPQINTFPLRYLFPFNPIDVMEIDKGASRGASTNTSSSHRGK